MKGALESPGGHLHCGDGLFVANSCLAFLATRVEAGKVKKEEKEVEEELPILRKKRQAEMEEEELDYEGDFISMLRKRRQIDAKEEEEEDEGDFISCPPGTLYCMAMDSCVRSCDEAYEQVEKEETKEGEEEWEVCAPGEFYCVGEGRCSKDCGRQAASLWDDDDEDVDDEGEWEVCRPGQVFCMEVMACVSDCGFFDDDQPVEQFDDDEEEMGGMDVGEFSGDASEFSWLEKEFSLAGGSFCPEGSVYCMMSAKCQDPSQPCKSKAQVESLRQDWHGIQKKENTKIP